ncbi:MAG: hypothetical protein H7X95_09770 [Deltaproteobacteria bacterium]|nr:hypothetical protein [Deltaproteobacteria bacterium]
MVVFSSGLAVFAVVAAAVASEPDVRGVTNCPSAQEVSARLAPMLSPEAAFPSGAFVELVDVPARVPGLLDIEVRLRQEGGNAPLAVRRIERGGGCSEGTDAVAVVAASWAGRYATSAPLPDPALSESPSVSIARPASASPSHRSSTVFSIGATAGVVAASAGGAAPWLGFEADVRRGRWALRFTGVAMGARAVVFPPGSAVWRRLMIHPNLGFAWGSSQVFAEVTAGPLIGVTETEGAGFTTNGSDVGMDLGLAPGFRLGARLAALSAVIWVGGSGLFWLRPHTVSAGGVSGSRTIPFLDICLGGGLTVLFGKNS